MSAIVILGLKLPFRSLWEKVGHKSRPSCSCTGSPTEYLFCPYCGQRKVERQIKVYRSLLTGEETVYRDINSIVNYLHQNNLDVHDTNPRGFTDDPVYIYFNNPCCYMEVTNTDPASMGALQSLPYELEEWLRDAVGDQIWQSGTFGLWGFMKDKPVEKEKEQKKAEQPRNEGARTFIIPIGPRDFE